MHGRKLRVCAAWLLLIGLAMAGCGDSFVPASYVAGLRVLGVRAEPAEAAAGETSTLRVLAVDTRGEPIALDWAACLLRPAPGASAIPPACATTDSADFLPPLGSGESVAVTLPALTAEDLVRIDFTGGIYLPVRIRARAGDTQLTSFYRMRYALGAPPNDNPAISSVSVVSDGVPTPIDPTMPLAVQSGARVVLRATLTADSAQDYLVFFGDPRTTPPETRRELPRIDWYATAGAFSRETTGEERPDVELDLATRPPAAGATIRLFVVVRDERGGTDWTERTLIVQ